MFRVSSGLKLQEHTASIFSVDVIYTMQIWAIHSSETLVIAQWTTRRHNPEDHNPHSHRRENIKSEAVLISHCHDHTDNELLSAGSEPLTT
jgi:hypothetical protein